GTTDNRSWNHGHEGEVLGADGITAQCAEQIEAARRRTARAMLATLLLASGTPMITAGDETGRTQQGNNNAYCQDNEISWNDWRHDRHARALRETVRTLLHLRGEHPQLRAPHFLRPADPDALDPGQVAWFGPDGRELSHQDWMDPSRHLLMMLRPGIPGPDGSADLLVIASAEDDITRVQLPRDPWPQGIARVLFDSGRESQADLPGRPLRAGSVDVGPGSVVVVGITPPDRLS